MSRLDLFVFVDALGWKLASERGVLARHCSYRQPLRTVLGYSCTCIPTILTGLKPQDHGHFAFFRYSPHASPFARLAWLRHLPARLTGSHRVRSWLSRLVRAWLGYTGYFHLYNVPFSLLPLLDYAEKRDLYRPGGIASRAATVFDALVERGIPHHVSDWRAAEDTNLRALERAIAAREIRAAYLYLADLDALLHRDGTESRACDAKLAQYEARFDGLLAHARAHYTDVRLHVFSDHGMADVRLLVDLERRLESHGVRQGEDYLAVFDSTMARVWILKDRAAEPIRRALASSPEGRLLTDTELAAHGCRFPGADFGELIFLLEPGAMIFPNHMGPRPVSGMHGYDPSDARSHASYLGSHAPPTPLGGLWDLKDMMLASAGAR